MKMLVGLVGALVGLAAGAPTTAAPTAAAQSTAAPAPTLFPGNGLSKFLTDYNANSLSYNHIDALAEWNLATNITAYNTNQSNIADAKLATFLNYQGNLLANPKAGYLPPSNGVAKQINTTTWRMINKIKDVGIKLNYTESILLSSYIANMSNTYSGASICAFVNGKKNCNVARWPLNPTIFSMMANQSTDYATLNYIWQEWRRQLAGNQAVYAKFVQLSNAGAAAGGYADTGAYWRSWYSAQPGPNSPSNFTAQIQQLYYQILPLYEQLHAYVRKQLMNRYKGKYTPLNTIPAHLTGNMWAQEWENMYSWSAPTKGLAALDVTQAMLNGNWTVQKMFRTADNFFQSIGFQPMTNTFWNKTQFVKPVKRTVDCHSSAWDLFQKGDFRIKMCTNINMDNLVTIHHEMGHIQYYMHYSNQPVIFRTGANPGFHEAIGDTIAKAAGTPMHLQKLGLLPNYQQNMKQDINYLYKQALEKVAFLPFGYLMDQWRWQVFSGNATPQNWNQAWWKLRYQLQGLNAPGQNATGAPGSSRPAGAFDPAAKSHIDDNTPYVRYFVSFIIQFQFYKSMCMAAYPNMTTPLYQCDFYNSTAAGNLLGNVLKLGGSVPWQQQMQMLTGQPQMSAGPLLEYFKPLQDWLTKTNKYSCECYGWGNDANLPQSVRATLAQPRCKAGAYVQKPCNHNNNNGNGAGSVLVSPLTMLFAASIALLLKLF